VSSVKYSIKCFLHSLQGWLNWSQWGLARECRSLSPTCCLLIAKQFFLWSGTGKGVLDVQLWISFQPECACKSHVGATTQVCFVCLLASFMSSLLEIWTLFCFQGFDSPVFDCLLIFEVSFKSVTNS